MTIHEMFVKRLIESGFWEDQAEAVMEMVKKDETNKAMAERWDHQIDGYPDTILPVLWLIVKHHALAWIDENLPEAWFRAMFTDEEV